MNTPLEIVLFVLGMAALIAPLAMLVTRFHRRYYLQLLKDAGMPQGTPEVEIERIRAAERAEARALYERLVREKLDVIRTALNMGAGEQELARLDLRLEELIGTDKLRALLNDPSTAPLPAAQLLDTDIEHERQALTKRPQAGAEHKQP